jgi:hypothetical protein
MLGHFLSDMDDLLVPTSIDDMIQMVTSLVLLTKKKKLNLMLCALVPAVHFPSVC